MRHIVHMDLDAFFVSVERLRNDALRDIPLLIGGGSDRGVVAAASYEARRFGIHSAMPMRMARRLCPHATVISGDMDSYSRYSHMVANIIAERVPAYEKSSIDEFYIDLSGMDQHLGCAKFSAELRDYILRESGLVVSYALASNKLLSKVATNEVKPNGSTTVPHGTERAYLAPLPVRKMPMIGEQTANLLYRMGVNTIKLLSEIPVPLMQNLMGKQGIELSRRAQGIDTTPIIPYREQKSISAETTLQQDTTDMALLGAKLAALAERVAYELRQQGRLTQCITLKLRYADFSTVSRQISVPQTSLDSSILKECQALFGKLYDRRLRIRLIGVRLSRLLQGHYQINLFDDTQEQISLYQSIDGIKNRFGSQLITTGSTFLGTEDMAKKIKSPFIRE